MSADHAVDVAAACSLDGALAARSAQVYDRGTRGAHTGMAGLIYDREARRLGPLLRGHLLLFDRREAPGYAAASGWALLAIFVVFEFALGPRLEHLTLLNTPIPANPARVAMQIAAVLILVRLGAGLRLRDVGFLSPTKWTATEALYFFQVVLAAGAVFYVLFLRGISLKLDAVQAAGLILLTQILWGFFQELMYRGLLQTELTRRFGMLAGIVLANIAFTFGPLHFYYFHSVMTDTAKAAMFGLIFAIGLFFAFIFARTRNLWIVGIFHGIGNLYTNGGAEIHSLFK
jgi:membrane protease YdiL (CAAX protease family)